MSCGPSRDLQLLRGELPGTLDISPQVFSLMLMDIMRSLAHLGVENIVVLMGHGGTESMRAARDAADMFLRRGPHYRKAKVAVVLFADLSPSAQRAFREGDYHSGYLETSLMLYWHPELVRDRSKWAVDSPELRERLRKDPDSYLVKRKPVDHPMVWPVAEQDPDIRVGVMGEPERSDPEFGRKVTEECVEALVELIKKMETAPEEGR
ncbi:MAG: hypothetical protein DRO93_15300 [Candidatus Thorarchaeota archaeon]|nr:MAG: hypothetical protein DRO93_15300 [Candidatus Thorarchaeota archaeon]